jgi:hypothetical protein
MQKPQTSNKTHVLAALHLTPFQKLQSDRDTLHLLPYSFSSPQSTKEKASQNGLSTAKRSVLTHHTTQHQQLSPSLAGS